jgi:hypothetical protein
MGNRFYNTIWQVVVSALVGNQTSVVGNQTSKVENQTSAVGNQTSVGLTSDQQGRKLFGPKS